MIIAHILIITKVGKELDVQKVLQKTQGVTESHIIYGQYDLILKVELPTPKELHIFIDKLRKDTENIKTTMTLICH